MYDIAPGEEDSETWTNKQYTSSSQKMVGLVTCNALRNENDTVTSKL